LAATASVLLTRITRIAYNTEIIDHPIYYMPQAQAHQTCGSRIGYSLHRCALLRLQCDI